MSVEHAHDEELLDVVKRVAPGTPLRAALDRVISAGTGALIVLGDDPSVAKISNGGFDIDCPFTEQRLFELGKMDGAIVLSDDASTIRRANVHLVPDSRLATAETGMRHRTAERVAKHTGHLTISVSQKRDVVTLYKGNLKYELEELRILLAKGNQALQTLEKYRSRFDQDAFRLSGLEFEDNVVLSDVAGLLQTGAMMRMVRGEIRRYIYELGIEGRLIALQLDELVADVDDDIHMMIMDYKAPSGRQAPDKIFESVVGMDSDELFDVNRVCALLGYRSEVNIGERRAHPKGYRILSRVPRLPTQIVLELGKRFGSLQRLMEASLEQLDEAEGVGETRARNISEGLRKLRENILYGGAS